MTDSKKLVEQVAQEIEASQTSSATAAGHSSRQPPSEALIDAITQVFGLFRLNYHNQFYAAYPEDEQVKQVMKLWLEALRDFPVEQILRGARHAIESSEYLPTLNKMIECCRESLSVYGLPDARSAYREACTRASPKSAQAWSHPAVYFAGRDSDWFFLANEPESKTWPVFQQAYQRHCARVMTGEELTIEAPAALPESSGTASSPEEALAELAKIRKQIAADST